MSRRWDSKAKLDDALAVNDTLAKVDTLAVDDNSRWMLRYSNVDDADEMTILARAGIRAADDTL